MLSLESAAADTISMVFFFFPLATMTDEKTATIDEIERTEREANETIESAKKDVKQRLEKLEVDHVAELDRIRGGAKEQRDRALASTEPEIEKQRKELESEAKQRVAAIDKIPDAKRTSAVKIIVQHLQQKN